MKQAMLADAIGTTFGSVCGTSTVCTYVESAAGIAEGGRSGLTAATTGALFLLALFFSPLFLLVPGAATTGSLFVVGVMMMKSIKEVQLTDLSEALPAFTIILTIVLTYSIAEGITLGMLSYTLMKVLTGQFRQISPTLYVLSVLFVLRYVFG